MKYALVFGIFSLMCAVQAAILPYWLVRLVFGSMAIAFMGVSMAYGSNNPRILLKTPHGTLHPLSYLLFLPYHLLNSLAILLFRWQGKENAFDKISENLFLGSRLSSRNSRQLLALGVEGVLDLTWEFSEVKELQRVPHYRNLPLLDTQAPTVEQLQGAVHWIAEKRKQHPVYVHCALGHGRSATVVAALLLYCREAATVEDALAKIKMLRPNIGLSRSQMQGLREFARTLSNGDCPMTQRPTTP